jgi:O-antigen/teichoic acid export membrane protein
MEDKAIRGVRWTMLGFATNRGLTLVTTVVLARLLVPKDFGLLALATIVVGVSQIIGSFGLGDALVVRRDFDERAKGTVLTLMLAIGTAMAVAVVAIAPLASDIFNEPRLTGVLAALAPTLVLSVIVSYYGVLLQGELEFRALFAAGAVQSGSYASVAITMAALGSGVWSLVVGQLVGMTAFAATLFALAPTHPRTTFDRETAREAWRTGRGFVGQGILAFVHQNTDYVVVGRTLGAAQLGFYSNAYRLAELPLWGIADPVAKVTFPGFTRMRERGEDVLPSFLSTLQAVALVTCPLGVLLSAAAEPFTAAVFGVKWVPMVAPLTIFGIWAVVRPLQNTLGWLYNSLGAAGYNARLWIFLLVPLIPALILAAGAGITPVAGVMLGHMTTLLVLFAIRARQRLGLSVGQLWGALRPVVLAVPGMWLAARGVSDATTSLPEGLRLAAAIAAGLAAYALGLVLVAPGLLRKRFEQARQTFGGAPASARSS